jgi:predicted PurR-regulated permease PerM
MQRDERWLSTALRLAPLLLFFWMVRAQLVPIFLGALFALLLDPLKRRLARRSPWLARQAALVLTVGSLILVVIPFVLIAANVVSSAQSFLAGGFTDILGRLQTFATTHFAGLADRFDLPVESLRTGAANLAQRIGGSIAGFASGVASSLPGQIVELFLFVLALYYFLRDGASLLRWLVRLSPFPEHDTDELFASIRETVHGAIFGQLATSLVQGGLTLIALYAFKIPGALMFGIIAMLLSVVPLVGTTPVTVGAAIYLLASGRFGAAAGMAAAAVVIGISDNVVRPWVQSSQTRMHPLVTLLSIFGGIEVLGAAGVFLGPVIAAMAIWTIDLYAGMHRKPSTSLPPTPPTAPAAPVAPAAPIAP